MLVFILTVIYLIGVLKDSLETFEEIGPDSLGSWVYLLVTAFLWPVFAGFYSYNRLKVLLKGSKEA